MPAPTAQWPITNNKLAWGLYLEGRNAAALARHGYYRSAYGAEIRAALAACLDAGGRIAAIDLATLARNKETLSAMCPNTCQPSVRTEHRARQ